MTRTYRTQSSTKSFWIVFLGLSLFFFAAAIRGVVAGTNGWLEVVVSMLLAIGGVAQLFTAYVSLSDESIEYGNLFASHFLRKDQISLRREYIEYQDGIDGGIDIEYLEFMPSEGIHHSVKIPKNDFNFDQPFWQWVSSVPEL